MSSAVRRTSCRNSFSRATLVATAVGAVGIGTLAVGDEVLAYDETTGTTASYPVSAVHINDDPLTGTVVIDGDVIETTPEHPFYTLEAGWLDAEDLEPGMRVPSADGDPGVVGSVEFTADPATMYNLTVEVAHTFFVGEGEWLVHNANCDGPIQYRIAGSSEHRTSHGKKVRPDPRAQGRPHTGIKWGKDEAGNRRVDGYTTFRSKNPYGAQPERIRFRGTGKVHSGSKPPHIYRPRRGGHQADYVSRARRYHIPRGYRL